MPANVQVTFVLAPPCLSLLPVASSAADAQLQACNARARQILTRRGSNAWLDLLTENEITRREELFR